MTPTPPEAIEAALALVRELAAHPDNRSPALTLDFFRKKARRIAALRDAEITVEHALADYASYRAGAASTKGRG